MAEIYNINTEKIISENLYKKIRKDVSDEMIAKLIDNFYTGTKNAYFFIIYFIKEVYDSTENKKFKEVFPVCPVPNKLLNTAFNDVKYWAGVLYDMYQKEFPKIIFTDYMDTINWVEGEISKL